MRKKKGPTVVLEDKHGKTQEFGIAHAERILDMGSNVNGGWQLPADSNYIYDEENGLRVKSDKANS